ncbi:MAG: DNA polymerase III subunit gamma/tau [Pyrinomonadaceae bacterium]
MSYQVIARKWRPQSFEEVTGQETITRTLRNALEHDRLHHAYLFSGARGVGKTTTARILAKALNCHKTDKPNLTPCLLTDPDACPSCIEISESRSMDVLEIDAASHTGIDDVRGSIIDNINFSPARDRYKVFIIDEVHQLSKPAFNALLKTLEEPPSEVVFVMATTELHKVPDTILSRCQEFLFRTISVQKIFDRLKLIASAENINIADEALRELARSGEGSMRDAQSNFDQVISFSGDKIEARDVTDALGFAGVDILNQTITAMANRDPQIALSVVDDLISRGHDLRNFCRDLLGLFRDLLVFKVAGSDTHLFEGAVFTPEDMKRMADSFGDADLLRFFNSLSETEASLREAVHPRYVLEMGLVKLIEMRKIASLESIIERLDALAGSQPSAMSAAAAPSADTEKKTLKTEPAEVSTPEEGPPDPSDVYIDYGEPLAEPQLAVDSLVASEPLVTHIRKPAPKAAAPVQAAFSPPPVRLLPLSAEELEHVDDKRLDDDFEAKLSISGDDLMPYLSAGELATTLLGDQSSLRTAAGNRASANGSAAGAAPARDAAQVPQTFAKLPQPVDLPQLKDDATEAELFDYAKAHPAVQNAMRVFRAKLIGVKRT